MSMKRTIPGGRVDAVYTQTKAGKEIIAASAVNMNDDEEDKAIFESEIAEESADNDEAVDETLEEPEEEKEEE